MKLPITYTYPKGSVYVGQWKDGRENGQGTFTISDGSKYVGEWKDNKTWNGKVYYKDVNIYGKFVNGK